MTFTLTRVGPGEYDVIVGDVKLGDVSRMQTSTGDGWFRSDPFYRPICYRTKEAAAKAIVRHHRDNASATQTQ